MPRVELTGNCHERPNFEFNPGSYFDTTTGEWYISINNPDTSPNTKFGYCIGFEIAFDGAAPSDNIGRCSAGKHLYINPGNILLISNGTPHGYISFSGSGKVDLTGHKTAILWMTCGADNDDCGVHTTKYWDLGSLISPPKISDLTNGNKYNGSDSISASETSITVNFRNASTTDTATCVDWAIQGVTEWYTYQLPEKDYVPPLGWANFVIPYSNFQPGTRYHLLINLRNSAGPGSDPPWMEIIIYTLHKRPTLVISHDHDTQSGLEDVTISWESDKNIQEIQYTIDGSEWIVYATGLNDTSGTMTICDKTVDGITTDLMPNSKYHFQVAVKSTDEYHYRWSAEPYPEIDCTTDERALLLSTSPRDLIVGERLRIYKRNESGNKNIVRLYIAENPEALWKVEESPSGTNDYYITITQDEWDTAYRRFINPSDSSKSTTEHNRINLIIHMVTVGRSREYKFEYTGYLILTGDMLTTKTNVSSSVKRGKVWTNVGGTIKRGVAWISTSTGVWRRGI